MKEERSGVRSGSSESERGTPPRYFVKKCVSASHGGQIDIRLCGPNRPVLFRSYIRICLANISKKLISIDRNSMQIYFLASSQSPSLSLPIHNAIQFIWCRVCKMENSRWVPTSMYSVYAYCWIRCHKIRIGSPSPMLDNESVLISLTFRQTNNLRCSCDK